MMSNDSAERNKAAAIFNLACDRNDPALFFEAAERGAKLKPPDYISAKISYFQSGKLALEAESKGQSVDIDPLVPLWRGARLADPLCLFTIGEHEKNVELAHACFNLADCFDHIRGEAGINPVARLQELEKRMDVAAIVRAEELAIETWRDIDKTTFFELHGRYSEAQLDNILATEADGTYDDLIRKLSVYTNTMLVGFPRCSGRAYELLKLGVEKEYIECIAALGIYAKQGLGVIPKAEREAFKLLERASRAGLPNAQAALAELYASGEDADQNLVKAYKLINGALKTEWRSELSINSRLVPEVDFEASALKRKLERNMTAAQLLEAVEGFAQ
jgi:hypothetical protein